MPPVAFARFRSEILDLYRPPHRRKSTHDKMRKVLDEFRDLPGIRRTSDITPGSIVSWIDAHDDRRPITNYTYLGAFRAAVNIAKKLHYVKVSPWEIRRDWFDWADLEPDPDEQPTTERHLTIAEIVRLLDLLDVEAIRGGWIEGRLQALGYLYLFTGMRKSEVLGLKQADVSLEQQYVRLRGRKKRRLKTRPSARFIPIHQELSPILQRWLPRCESEWVIPGLRRKVAWTGGSRGKKPLDAIRAAGERAGIEAVTIQDLRRSISTHAKRFGLGLLEVQDLLGHGATQTAREWYLEEDLADARAAIGKIDYRACARRSVV